MKNSTYGSLVAKHGGKMVPLTNEIALEYAGLKLAKTAISEFNKGNLPFPLFRIGNKHGKWKVNMEKLADYLDSKDREYTEKFNYLHN